MIGLAVPRLRAGVAPPLVVGLGYYVAGRLALPMAIPPGYATAVWPAAGLALVSVLLLCYRVWPSIAFGSFLVNVGTSFDTSSTLMILKSLSLAASIVGAALQGTRLVPSGSCIAAIDCRET